MCLGLTRGSLGRIFPLGNCIVSVVLGVLWDCWFVVVSVRVFCVDES